MIGSRASRGRQAAIALAAAALLAAVPASAQVGAPIQLTPRRPAAEPPAAPSPETALPETAPSGPPSSGVVVEGLEDVAAEAVGLLGPAQGGFGTTMWQGTERAVVERLLPLLPVGTHNRTARDLMRRLLLSAAIPPAGAANGRSLLAVRASHLAAMGDVASASTLVEASPGWETSADLSATRLETLLLQNDIAGACNLATAISHTSVAWQQTQVFCHTIANDSAIAALGLELLREQGVDDPVFYALIDRLGGDGAPDNGAPGAATALNLAMLRASSTPVPPWFSEAASPALLAALSSAPNAELSMRVAAAERAEPTGALAARQLEQLYRSLNLTPDQVTAAVIAPPEEAHPSALAAGYLAARAQSVPAARAEALRRAWESGRAVGNFETMARLSGELLFEIAPAAPLAWFAADAARVMLLAGRPDQALAWHQQALTEAPFEADASRAEAQAWPLLRLAFGDAGGRALAWDAARFRAWTELQGERDPDDARRRIALMRVVMQALGEPIEAEGWTGLISGVASSAGAVPEAAALFGLESAAAAGRVGETVLLVLLALGEGAAGEAHPLVLHAGISALNQVGLQNDARSLAVEAVISAGL